MKSIFTILTLLFSCFTSCQQQAPSFKSVSVEEFAEVIANPEVQRLDVRRQEEFAEGHIPGSQLIDVLDEANFEILKNYIDKKPYGMKSKDSLTSLLSTAENTFKSE